MKRQSASSSFAVLVLLLTGAAAAQDDAIDRVTVELTNPGEPAHLSVDLVNGGITVNGYAGKEVIIEAQGRLRKLEKAVKGTGKAAGLTRIPINSSTFTVEEYGNRITIGTESWAQPVDLRIRVPEATSLELSCVNSGDIRVAGVTGDLEVSNVNGAVTLLNIKGSVIANAQNGDVTVTFVGVDPEKDMSFSSFNGDVDVTFPVSLKANVRLKTVQGDIFTDFRIEEVENLERVIRKAHRDADGKYQVSVDRAFWGTINGGGQELHFSNFNGDIFIRKDE